MNEIPKIVLNLRKAFKSGKTKSVQWRREQLTNMLRMLEEREDAFLNALNVDCHKSAFEGRLCEMNQLKGEISYTLKNLTTWMTPKYVSSGIAHMPSTALIRPEPLGVVLVIGTWNFPYTVTLGPLIGAIAAGNCAVVKTSEVTPSASKVMREMLHEYLDTDCFQVVEGAVPEATALLKEKFDHIFFTGSESIGRVVYEAAAKQLTTCTLELGGKSPTVIDETANVTMAAQRILWAKTINCGQVCICPDYVMVVKEQEKAFYEAMKKAFEMFFPNGVGEADNYSRIVNHRHTDRLLALMDEDESIVGKVLFGGKYDREDKFIEPTLFQGTKPEAKIMKGEIFGPLIPVMVVDNLDSAIEYIVDQPKPLSAYLFTNSTSNKEKYINAVTAGGMVINDVMVHFSVKDLPFGGVGNSGMGAYHGRASFDVFSHKKSILQKSGKSIFDPSLRYPPYSDTKKWAQETFF